VGDSLLVKAEQNRLHPRRMVVSVDAYVIGPVIRPRSRLGSVGSSGRHAGQSRGVPSGAAL
jgi:hypothetical protein